MADSACEKTFKIGNELGLHLRAAGKFAQTAGKYEAEVWVKKDQTEVNGKSIMGILSLAASRGTEVIVRTKGKDAAIALAALSALIEANFHEE